MVAEYAPRGMTQPIGVSQYELTRALPRQLRSSLPSIEAIEAELSGPPTNHRAAKRRPVRRNAEWKGRSHEPLANGAAERDVRPMALLPLP